MYCSNIILVALFLIAPVFHDMEAQSLNSDILSADSLLSIANSFYNKNKYDESKKHYVLAHEKFQNLGRHKKSVTALNYANFIDYNILKDNITFNESASLTYTLAEEHLDENDVEYIWALEQYATSSYALSNYLKAIESYQRVLHVKMLNGYKIENLNITRRSLSNCYKFLGDQEKALLYFKSTTPNPKDDLKDYYYDFARLHEYLGNIDSAIVHITNCIDRLTGKESVEKQLKYFLAASEIYTKNHNYKNANRFLNQAQLLETDNSYYRIFRLESIGKSLELKERHAEALAYFEQADALADQTEKKNTPSFKSKRYRSMYYNALPKGDTAQVVNILQKAININRIGVSATDFEDASNFTNKQEALFFIRQLALYTYFQYKNNLEEDTLKKAFQLYRLSIDLVISIRQEVASLESKNNLIEENEILFSRGVESAFALHRITKDDAFLKYALIIAEQKKALQLLESTSNKEAQKLGSVPDSLIIKERNLILQQNQAKKIFLESKDPSEKRSRALAEINRLKLEFDNLIHSMGREYPQYFKLKYGAKEISFDDIEKKTHDEKSAIIEYFISDSTIYSFVLQGNQIKAFQIDNSEDLRSSIDSLRILISRPPSSKDAQKEYGSFIRNNSRIYNDLVNPFISSLRSDNKSIVLIPDSHLNNVPFGILAKKVLDPSGYQLSNIHYLFADYNISYQYSALHWEQLTRSSTIKKDIHFGGFAPTFLGKNASRNRDCEYRKVQNLKCTKEEIDIVSTHLQGATYSGGKATLLQFEQALNEIDIIHLATHACIDTINPNLSRLYFNDGEMTMLDLNSLDIRAKLAVLSACETGLGEYIAGDGVQSLAWSFIEAGCESTVMSIWSIDDCATVDFMDSYYAHLKKGARKDAALRNAKLDFLNKMDVTRQHPFYWAPFITYGSMEPIFKKDLITLTSLSVGLFVSVLVLLLLTKFSRSTSI